MASVQNFRTKHNAALNQLKAEKQDMAEELDALRAKPDLEAEFAQLQEENAALAAQVAELTTQVEALNNQLADAQQIVPLADEELEAYRRAEKAERTARERAKQIYCQATGALADATAQVDDAAEHYKILSQRITEQLSELQATVEHSKNALQGAAATMYTIRPTDGLED